MIFLEMLHGLGNQLFMYAFFRWVQEQTRQGGAAYVSPPGVGHTNYQLHKYNITPNLWTYNDRAAWLRLSHAYLAAAERECDAAAGPAGLSQGQRAERFRAAQGRLNALGILAVRDGYCPVLVRPGLKDYYLHGYFQSERFFYQIRDKIKSELVYNGKFRHSNAAMLYRIRSTPNAVCVHVRRGDYVKFPILDICGPRYYARAMQLMRAMRPGSSFFVFSNGMGWVRKNIPFPEGTVFVDGNGEDDAVQELELMRACSHFIIANSTFSWWAQYLGVYPYKAVIAPCRFFRDDTPSDAHMKDWVTIDPDG